MAAATQSCLALIRPMSKRRSRVVLTGPWPVRMLQPVLVEGVVENVVDGLVRPAPWGARQILGE